MTTADGWLTCDLGHPHWGRAGAAGLLIRHGRVDDVLGLTAQYVVRSVRTSVPGLHARTTDSRATGSRPGT